MTASDETLGRSVQLEREMDVTEQASEGEDTTSTIPLENPISLEKTMNEVSRSMSAFVESHAKHSNVLQRKLERAIVRINELKEEKAQLTKELTITHAKLVDVEIDNEEKARLKKELTITRAKLVDVEFDNETLKLEVEKNLLGGHERIQTLEAENSRLEKELKQAQANERLGKTTIQTLEAENTRLEKELKQTQAKIANERLGKTTIQTLEAENTRLEKELKQTQAKIANERLGKTTIQSSGGADRLSGLLQQATIHQVEDLRQEINLLKDNQGSRWPVDVQAAIAAMKAQLSSLKASLYLHSPLSRQPSDLAWLHFCTASEDRLKLLKKEVGMAAEQVAQYKLVVTTNVLTHLNAMHAAIMAHGENENQLSDDSGVRQQPIGIVLAHTQLRPLGLWPDRSISGVIQPPGRRKCGKPENDRPCSVDGCNNAAKIHDRCKVHRARNSNSGVNSKRTAGEQEVVK
ncbi:hypothetical protein AC1031_017268 [Aphanomyces cochlioides]|nr:hypothetical protein AC1031_017268 [Aphanomyces cochlioides]